VAVRRRGGRPTQDDARRNSETLLSAAAALFVERGYNGTSMEAVAQAAGLGKQALYMRYADKESLFMAVIERLKEDDRFEAPPPDDALPLAAGLARRLRAILANAAGARPMLICTLAFREGHRFPRLLELLTEGSAERYTRPLAEWMRRRQQAGEVRALDCGDAAALCVDLVFAEVTRAMFRATPMTAAAIEASAERIARLALGGIRA
jgi:AcrR family transcriptional regulator